MHVHTRRLIKKVNISPGARNLGEKRLQNNARKTKNGKELRERGGETFAVRSCKLSGVHFLLY